MTDQTTETGSDLVSLTADIVATYVANNQVSHEALGDLVSSVHAALGACSGEPEGSPEEAPVKPTTAQVRRSIRGDHLISFEDGKAYKFLKRHLAVHGMTPDDYRRKWSLPADYPMVAPEYSRKRSELAKSMKLGGKVRGRRKA